MKKSIMQTTDQRNRCYLCYHMYGIEWTARALEEHHVMFGTADRKISDDYGLTVMLCPEHHRTGEQAVHRSRMTNMLLRAMAQEAFEKEYSHEKWMELFGRNYL